MLEVIEVRYPLTVIPPEQQVYNLENSKSLRIDSRNGEMALVPVVIIEHYDGTETHIDMSACVVRQRNPRNLTKIQGEEANE